MGDAEKVFLIQDGDSDTVDDMLRKKNAADGARTWFIRLAGFCLGLIGIMLFFSPVIKMARYIPLLGSFVSAGIWLLAFMLTLLTATTTISLAWIRFRPLVAVPLVIVYALFYFSAEAAAKKYSGKTLDGSKDPTKNPEYYGGNHFRDTPADKDYDKWDKEAWAAKKADGQTKGRRRLLDSTSSTKFSVGFSQ